MYFMSRINVHTNKEENMKITVLIPSLLPLATTLAIAVAPSCTRSSAAGNETAKDDGSQPSDLPAAVVTVSKSIAAGDPKGFASIVSYPLSRPYPIKDIADSAAMIEYFPILVDDSLRNIIANARPERWNENGYRGWTLDNGEYIWIDDSIYSVNYTSVAEQALRAMLVREEIESLAQPMRPGWTPAFCLYGVDNGNVYRVDVSISDRRPGAGLADSTSSGDEPVLTYPDNRTAGEDGVYRLAIYQRGDDLRGQPSALMTGRMAIEGSVGTRVYYFRDERGDSAQYVYDQIADEDIPEIIIVKSGQHPRHDKVKRAYWRDYLSRHR